MDDLCARLDKLPVRVTLPSEVAAMGMRGAEEGEEEKEKTRKTRQEKGRGKKKAKAKRSEDGTENLGAKGMMR